MTAIIGSPYHPPSPSLDCAMINSLVDNYYLYNTHATCRVISNHGMDPPTIVMGISGKADVLVNVPEARR